MTCCGCNSFIEIPSGGFKLGGNATQSSNSTLPKGGVVCGGSALVDCPRQCWDDYIAVYHLRELCGFDGTWDGTNYEQDSTSWDGTSLDTTSCEYEDSARYHFDGYGGDGADLSTIPVRTDGLLCGYCQNLNGHEFITCPPDNLGNDTCLFVSGWCKIQTWFADRSIYGRRNGSSSTYWQMSVGHDYLRRVKASVQVIVAGEPVTYVCVGATIMPVDTWCLIAACWIPGKSLSVYFNSSTPDATITIPSTATTFGTGGTTGVTIGGFNGASYMTGDLQDVWISPDPLRVNTLTDLKTAYCLCDGTDGDTDTCYYD